MEFDRLSVMTHDEALLKLKAYIFASRSVRIYRIQRLFCIDYHAAILMVGEIERAGFVESRCPGEMVINWHHPGWLEIARQPELWLPQMLAILEGEFLLEEKDGRWLCFRRVYEQERLIAEFGTECEALNYLDQR